MLKINVEQLNPLSSMKSQYGDDAVNRVLWELFNLRWMHKVVGSKQHTGELVGIINSFTILL